LPEIGERLGRSIGSFKKAMSEKDGPKEEASSTKQKDEKKDNKKNSYKTLFEHH